MNYIAFVGVFAFMSVVAATVLASSADAAPSLNASENNTSQSLDVRNVTTSWDLTFLYKDKDAAKKEYQRLNRSLEQINPQEALRRRHGHCVAQSKSA